MQRLRDQVAQIFSRAKKTAQTYSWKKLDRFMSPGYNRRFLDHFQGGVNHELNDYYGAIFGVLNQFEERQADTFSRHVRIGKAAFKRLTSRKNNLEVRLVELGQGGSEAEKNQHEAEKASALNEELEQTRLRFNELFQTRFGLGNHFDFDEFMHELESLTSKENIRITGKSRLRKENPEAQANMLLQMARGLKSQTKLSQAFMLHGLGAFNPFGSSRKKLWRFLARQYLGSHFGHQVADNLCSDDRVDYEFLVKNLERKGPHRLAELTPSDVGFNFEKSLKNAKKSTPNMWVARAALYTTMALATALNVPAGHAAGMHGIPGSKAWLAVSKQFNDVRARLQVHQDALTTIQLPFIEDEKWHAKSENANAPVDGKKDHKLADLSNDSLPKNELLPGGAQSDFSLPDSVPTPIRGESLLNAASSHAVTSVGATGLNAGVNDVAFVRAWLDIKRLYDPQLENALQSGDVKTVRGYALAVAKSLNETRQKLTLGKKFSWKGQKKTNNQGVIQWVGKRVDGGFTAYNLYKISRAMGRSAVEQRIGLLLSYRRHLAAVEAENKAAGKNGS